MLLYVSIVVSAVHDRAVSSVIKLVLCPPSFFWLFVCGVFVFAAMSVAVPKDTVEKIITHINNLEAKLASNDEYAAGLRVIEWQQKNEKLYAETADVIQACHTVPEATAVSKFIQLIEGRNKQDPRVEKLKVYVDLLERHHERSSMVQHIRALEDLAKELYYMLNAKPISKVSALKQAR
jgi:hypothetical protein